MKHYHPDTGRRRFLKTAGVAIALPMLELIRPAIAAGTNPSSTPAKRLVCTGAYLGYHREAIYPQQTGPDRPKPHD